MRTLVRIGLAALGCGLALRLGAAQAKDFYEGKTVEFVVPEGVGGGFDILSRLVARYIGQHLPGDPTIVVRNMPGAGGIVAANYLYSVAPQDGSSIGMIEEAVYEAQLLKTAELRLDVRKFNWIGRVMSNNAVLVGSHSAPVQKIEDAYQKPLIISATGLSSQMRWTMLKNATGMKLKLVIGQPGAAEALLAMQRGEVDAVSSPWSVFRVQHADWIGDKTVNILLQTAPERAPDLPNVARLTDLAKTSEQRRIFELFSEPEEVGRSLVAPPNVTADRVKDLRTAFEQTFQDPGFQAALKMSKLTLDPLDGQALTKLIGSSFAVPPELVTEARALARPR